MSARYQLLDRGVWDHQTRATVLPGTPAWTAYLEWLTAGGVPLPMDAVGQDDLATAKAKRTAEIDAYAAGLRNKIIAGKSAGEMASWGIKLLDALAVSAGQPTPFASMLPTLGTAVGLPQAPTSVNAALATIRGITETEHIQKVMVLADQFLLAEVVLDAVRGKHCDAINALTDVRDVIVYDWKAGWPQVAP